MQTDVEGITAAKVSSARVLAALTGLWLVLWAASVVQDIIIVTTGTEAKVWLLDVDTERSFYTWFSTLLLAFGGLLALILSMRRHVAAPKLWQYWRALGLIFLFLSMDEMLSFHEVLSAVLGRKFSTDGAFTFIWVIPAMGLVIVLGLFFLPFLARLPREVAGQSLLA